MNSPATDPDTTLDRIWGGRLLLRQPRRGHRAGTDAVLLAAFAEPRPGDTAVDLGAGVGTVGLILALREPRLQVVLVERDPCLATLASENAALNGVADRVSVECRDAFAPGPQRGAGLVVCNPPFYTDAEARPSPHPWRAAAHHLAGRNHGAWLEAAMGQARQGGRVAIINRPEALPGLLAAGGGRLGAMAIRSVHPRDGRPATRVLVAGVIGAKAPLVLMAPLVLHIEGGDFGEEAAAAHGKPVARRENTKAGPEAGSVGIAGSLDQQTRTRRGP